jgi:hypothetical protein
MAELRYLGMYETLYYHEGLEVTLGKACFCVLR